MKKIVVSLVLVLLAALPAAAAQARGGLDQSFGVGGRLLLPASPPLPPSTSEFNERLLTAAAPEGKLVAVVGDTQLLRFLANGKPDPSLGGDGGVDLRVEPGHSFTPVGVAVDSQGRILVAGTSAPPAGTPNRDPEGAEGPAPTRATVIRYLPSGELDPGFGAGGIATTSFGLPAPATAPGYVNRRYEEAVVSATALTVNAADQPIVAGVYATLASSSCYASDGFVGRLDASGDLDRSFGKDGAAVDASIRQPQRLAQSPLGDTFYSGLNSPKPVGCLSPGPQSIAGGLAALLPTGAPDTAFAGGQVQVAESVIYGLAVDSRGRLVTLEQHYSSAYPEDEGRLRVRRLQPSGAPDPAFGKGGTAWPPATLGAYRRVGIESLALDSRNRILLAGGAKTPKGAFGFQLMRMGTKGKLDRSFGRRGRIKTGFGRTAQTKASAIVLSGGRAVLSGRITGSPKLPGGFGFAIARHSL